MNVVLGCVLAVRDRPPEVLERALQTYTFQTVAPADKVLLDYGSGLKFAEAYRRLCDRYAWRLVVEYPAEPRWSLSAAYNAAVAALHTDVTVVFKSDIDVLLGPDVLETAATLGRDRLCLFECRTTRPGQTYPPQITGPGDLLAILNGPVPLETMPAEGLHAYPRQWFERIGGFDLQFSGWGFEDSDLRERAKRTIGIVQVTSCLLIHQWHPYSRRVEDVTRNEGHYRKMNPTGDVVRNSGRLRARPITPALPEPVRSTSGLTPAESPLLRLAVATRSMNDVLYRWSGELLRLDGAGLGPVEWQRHRVMGTDSLNYFRSLLTLDADWVVNLDEDAFLLDPRRLLGLIRHMAEGGYAACGMPDGGVVSMRRHHPAVCNAFFSVFDLRRVRIAWQDWDRVLSAKLRPEHEQVVAPFARRGTLAFDHFERYYGIFFRLLDAGERILYLDAEEWQDGISTLLKDREGEPLLLHCWYSRHWDTSYHTRRRCWAAVVYARQSQGLPAAEADRTEFSIPPVNSNVGKWDQLYQQTTKPQPYGDTLTYEKAARFLGMLATVEDWGCGWAWFKRYLGPSVHYKGIDGSHSPFADEVADLTKYTSNAEGILLRHVLEHNHDWAAILSNAIRSFRKRLVLVFFTPFAETTHIICMNSIGVPDLAFAKADLVRFFPGCRWSLEEGLRTETQYGVEHIYYLERE